MEAFRSVLVVKLACVNEAQDCLSWAN